MNSEALVELALQSLSCNQKELAARLGVSPTQISKWKKGEYMSSDMEQKIQKLVDIDDMDPEFVLWAGSLNNAKKWEKLIRKLADSAMEDAETGYNTYPLSEEEPNLCWKTFLTLRQMGVEIPSEFPAELDIDYELDGYDDDEAIAAAEDLWAQIEKNPHSALITRIYGSLNDVYGFYAAYVHYLINDDTLDLYDTDACNIEPCLMELAGSKIEVDSIFAPRFREFQRQSMKNYESWLSIVKDAAFRAGIPLKAELLGMVYDSHDELGQDAEAESLGFNSTRLHPDIYMNELLCGMRLIHQVLPVIMKKLGIDEDEFELDESELRIR